MSCCVAKFGYKTVSPFKAKLTYEDGAERGFTAMLLKEDDSAGDIFQCYLGNLPPKTNAKLSFAYALELPQEPDGRIRFTLPTVLNPRYSSGIVNTVKPVLSGHSKIDKTKVLKTSGSLTKVESIAEFCIYF